MGIFNPPVSGGGGGSGTVTSVSVATANGFSGTVANATTTPAITIIAGAITPTTVNGATITTTTSGTLTLANSSTLATSGANSITLTSTGTTNVTLPTTGTLATLAGTEELTNKTLTASVAKGTWTASGTWTIPAVTLGGTVTSNGQSFSGTIANLGTVTTADINGGTVDGTIIGGASAAAATVTTLGAGTTTITSSSANSLAIGQTGATNPILQVDSSTASAVVGIKITGGASGGGTTLTAQGGGTNEGITLISKAGGDSAIDTGSSAGTAKIKVGGVAKFSVSSSIFTYSPGTSGTAANNRWAYITAANTALTGGAEFTQVYFDLTNGGASSNQHASNTAITTQRDVRIDGMKHSFASATGTIANAYACWFQAPTAGTNAVITNAYSLGTDGNIFSTGKIVLDSTITGGGTTGNQTINKPSGTVNIAATGTTVTVTNSFCTTSSIVMAVVRTNDTTALIKNVVPGSGSFVITMNAAVTAETSIGFIVYN